MRGMFIALTLLVSSAGNSPVAANEDVAFAWQAWRHLPVQEGGRHKPLDTLAWETLRRSPIAPDRRPADGTAVGCDYLLPGNPL